MPRRHRTARQKLSTLHIQIALIMAALIGLATGSCTVFVLAAAVLVGLAVAAGDIRIRPPR